MEHAELVKAVAGSSRRKGTIALAADYLSALDVCLADGRCALKYAAAGSPERWAQALKEAATKLVYHSDDMDVLGGLANFDTTGAHVFGASKDSLPVTMTDNAIMEFECCLTSTRKDRDGDILESEGAKIDPKHALLWQHFPFDPIGKHVGITQRSERRVNTRNAIANTPLGHDAAVMVEFKAVRISHGFRPIKWEQLEKDKGEPDWRIGFHVKEFEVVETSLVSVPSNTDAQILAFSRGKLHHPLVKGYAEALWERLPTVVTSGWEAPKDTKAGCGCEDHNLCLCGKTVSAEDFAKLTTEDTDLPSEKPYPNEHSCRINQPSKYEKFRRQNRKDKKGRTIGMIFGQLKGKTDWELQAMRFPKDDWKVEDARKACKAASGSFEPASTSTEPEDIKQKISQRNLGKIKEARGLVVEVCDKMKGMDGTSSMCAMAEKGAKLLDEVIADATGNDQGATHLSADELAVKMVAALARGAVGEGYLLALQEELSKAQNRSLEKFLVELVAAN